MLEVMKLNTILVFFLTQNYEESHEGSRMR